jgi:carbamoyl-phosphate synthase large subunit
MPKDTPLNQYHNRFRSCYWSWIWLCGSQSARSIREEGIEVILINSNPATMTDPSMADHIYLKPLTTKSIIEILKAHPQIDSVLQLWWTNGFEPVSWGGWKGIWQDFEKMIGVDVNAINITENREQFKQLLKKIECRLPCRNMYLP